MLDYALEYEIVDKNYARTFEISDDIIKEKDENKKAILFLRRMNYRLCGLMQTPFRMSIGL